MGIVTSCQPRRNDKNDRPGEDEQWVSRSGGVLLYKE